ncbi:hypothetical protein ACLMJK_001527 [Lecanora helva]
MERKSKYTLFPVTPSPLPPPREPLPALPQACSPTRTEEQIRQIQESPTLPPQDLLPVHPAGRPSTAPPSAPPPCPPNSLSPAAEETSNPWPPRNNSWSPHEETSSTLNETPPVAETSSQCKMHVASCSASSSESSLHKPVTTTTSDPPPNPRNRPRTVYFHSGIGGAGNYHKAIREDNVLRPMVSHRTNQSRFLSSLLGTLGGKRGRRHQQQQQRPSSDGAESPQSGSQSLPLGAAEVMRRKMLGIGSDGRLKESCNRS